MCVSVKKCVQSLGIASFLLVLWPSVVFSQENTQIGDQIVAIVNNDVITAGELDLQVRLLQVQGRLPEIVDEELKKQVLGSLVNEYAQLQRAAQVGMGLNRQDKQQAISAFMTKQKITQPQLEKALKEKNVSIRDLVNRLSKGVLIQRLVRADVGRSVFVGDDEIANFVKTNNIKASSKSYAFSYLLVKLSGSNNDQKNAILRKVEGALNNNIKSLGQLAQRLAQKGIRTEQKTVGLTEDAGIPEAFLNELSSIEKKELTGVVKASSGLYVLQLDDVNGFIEGPEKRLAQHILIEAKSPLEFKRAELQVRNLKQQIIDGTSFESLAQYYSDDSSSAAKGGDVGWIERGVLVPAFEQGLFSLEKGQLSGPVSSPFGVHLIRLNDVTTEQEPEEQVRAIAYNALMTQKVQQYYPAWLSELVGRAYVRYM